MCIVATGIFRVVADAVNAVVVKVFDDLVAAFFGSTELDVEVAPAVACHVGTESRCRLSGYSDAVLMCNIGKITRQTHEAVAPCSPSRDVLPHREHFAIEQAIRQDFKRRLGRVAVTESVWPPVEYLLAIVRIVFVFAVDAISVPFPPRNEFGIDLCCRVDKSCFRFYARDEEIVVIR